MAIPTKCALRIIAAHIGKSGLKWRNGGVTIWTNCAAGQILFAFQTVWPVKSIIAWQCSLLALSYQGRIGELKMRLGWDEIKRRAKSI